jgi:hypothetical protein
MRCSFGRRGQMIAKAEDFLLCVQCIYKFRPVTNRTMQMNGYCPGIGATQE